MNDFVHAPVKLGKFFITERFPVTDLAKVSPRGDGVIDGDGTFRE